jgi:hypothetical protein
LISGATLKAVARTARQMFYHKDQINADLPAFISE